MHFNQHDFRHCLGHFATGITVATTRDKNQPTGVTINSFSSVSLEPPLVLFSLEKKAVAYPAFKKSATFTINILSQEQAHFSRLFTHPEKVQWPTIDYTTDQLKNPILPDVIAYLECNTKAFYDGGDHSILLGEVVNLSILTEDPPLLYYRGEYCTLGTPLEEED